MSCRMQLCIALNADVNTCNPQSSVMKVTRASRVFTLLLSVLSRRLARKLYHTSQGRLTDVYHVLDTDRMLWRKEITAVGASVNSARSGLSFSTDLDNLKRLSLSN